jgi:Tol biopolymer transport system component
MWSPANKIVFCEYASGSRTLFEVDADGQNRRQCPIFEPGDYDPVWTYDGSKLVCGGDEGIVVMNADGSDRRTIRSPQGAIQWAISPDAQSVVYSSSRETRNSGFELFIVDLNDESKRKLVANPMKGNKEVDSRYVSWSPRL